MCSLMLLTECSQKSRTKTPCSWTQSLFLFPLQLHFHLQTHHIFPIQMNLFKTKMTWRDGQPSSTITSRRRKLAHICQQKALRRPRTNSRRYLNPISLSSSTAPVNLLPAGPPFKLVLQRHQPNIISVEAGQRLNCKEGLATSSVAGKPQWNHSYELSTSLLPHKTPPC